MVLGPEPGLLHSMAEAASAPLAGLPATLPDVLLPGAFKKVVVKHEPDMVTSGLTATQRTLKRHGRAERYDLFRKPLCSFSLMMVYTKQWRNCRTCSLDWEQRQVD